MSKAIANILKAATSVTNNLSGGANSIMHLMEIQGASPPYIVIKSSIINPNTTQTGQKIDEWSVSLFVVAEYLYDQTGGIVGADTIANNARTELHDTTYSSDNVAGVSFDDQLEPDIFNENNVKRIQIEQTYTLWTHR